MDNKTLINRFREEFFHSLNSKTSWGRNEVMSLFAISLTNVLLDNDIKEPPIPKEPTADYGMCLRCGEMTHINDLELVDGILVCKPCVNVDYEIYNIVESGDNINDDTVPFD